MKRSTRSRRCRWVLRLARLGGGSVVVVVRLRPEAQWPIAQESGGPSRRLEQGLTQRLTSGAARRRRWLAPGESLVAWGGLALVAVLLLAVAGAGWWSMRVWSDSADAALHREADRLAHLIATVAEMSLVDATPTALRRTVADAAHDGWVIDVTLDGVGVVAADDTGLVTRGELPTQWTDAGPAAFGSTGIAASGVIELGFRVPGRGTGVVKVTAPDASSAAADSAWAFRAGSLAAAGLGLVALLAVYRAMRARLRGIASIGDALSLIARGEDRIDVLLVDEQYADIGEAWNGLLEDRRRLRGGEASARIEQALSEGGQHQTELRAAFGAVQDGLMLVDSDGCVLEANGAAGVLLRMGSEPLIGGDARTFLGGGLAGVVSPCLNAAGGPAVVEDVEAPGEDGATVLRVAARPLRDAGRAAILVQLQDVTQSRLAERGRGAFLAQATHELRTPLTNIRLYVEQAIEEGDEDPSLRDEALNVVGKESRRLERIVSDMLSVAELEAGSLSIRQEDVQLERLLDELESDYRPQAEAKEILLRFDLPPRLPVLQGDQDRLGLVLHNLMGNALKYTPAGGGVVVGASVDDAGTFRLWVRDTGIGIAPDQAERIFERFTRAEDDRVRHVTGTGLGLALAREVARAHGGDIELASEIDKGSTFTLVLPGAVEESMAA